MLSTIGERSWEVDKTGGDCTKSEDVSSLLVTRIALSLGALIESTRRSELEDTSKVRDGFRAAGA